MKFGLKSRDKVIVGLDIGSSSVKAVKLKYSGGLVELAGFEIEPLSADPALALKKIKESLGADSVNTSLSGSSTVIRYVIFPRMSPQELKQALKFEAQKHIPFAVSDANLDGVILKNDLADNKMLVLLAAAKKESVNQRLKFLADSGLKVYLLELDSLALFNCFDFNFPKAELKENKAFALLNIGTGIVNLNIVDEGLMRLSRDIHLDIPEAPQKTDASLNNLATEIRVSFDFFESQNASSVSKIFLSGGGANRAGLKEALAASLGIEAVAWDPLRRISIPQGIDLDKLKGASGSLAVAIGLALRE